MVVDGTGSINVRVLAEAHAFIDAIRQLDPYTGLWYSLYPEGQQGYCHVGETCWLNMRLRNDGDASGTLYLKVTRNDTGAVIFNQSYTLGVNNYVDISNPAPNFVMPATDIYLTFEIGH